MGYEIKCKCGHKVYISDTDGRGACERCRSTFTNPATFIPKTAKTTKHITKNPINTAKNVDLDPTTNQIRIKLFMKETVEIKLKNSFQRLKNEYPKVIMENETFDSFIQKVFPAKIKQRCVIKNQSYKMIKDMLFEK